MCKHVRSRSESESERANQFDLIDPKPSDLTLSRLKSQ
jgi:hypothetical protein